MPTRRARSPRRWQFTMKTLVLLPVYSLLVMVGFCAILAVLGGEARGIGFPSITLDFVAVDSATLSPISGAVVTVYEPDHPRAVIQKAATSSIGKAVVTREFPCYISGGTPFRRAKALVYFDPLCFEVSAPGYKPVRCWLTQFTGRIHDLERSKPRPVAKVTLDRLDR